MPSTDTEAEVAPILRTVFPEFSEQQLHLAQEEFSRFFGLLYDDYLEDGHKEPLKDSIH